MYAIVDFKGSQLRIQKNDILSVPYLKNIESGSKIEMDKVLLFVDSDKIEVGNPYLTSIKVSAELISHKKEKKIIVFKKKRRKGYRKKQGHRQKYSEVKIVNIKRG